MEHTWPSLDENQNNQNNNKLINYDVIKSVTKQEE
jgi:hypothetical protein